MDTAYSAEGDKPLENLHNASRFTDWMYAQVKPHLKGDILEIGSGIGTYSEKIIRNFPEGRITLSEIDPSYRRILASKFEGGDKRIRVTALDLQSAAHFQDDNIAGKFDSCFALNVLEHVKDDTMALKNICNVLVPGGVFVVLVPAHPLLFNNLDVAFGHYRRYTKKYFRNIVANTDFKLEKMFMFNALAIPGWFVNGTILRKKTLDEGSLKIFNYLVPLLNFTEKIILRQKIGISLIAVLKKI